MCLHGALEDPVMAFKEKLYACSIYKPDERALIRLILHFGNSMMLAASPSADPGARRLLSMFCSLNCGLM